MASVSQALALFGPSSLTWRLIAAVLGAMPKAPDLVHYASVAEAARSVAPAVDPAAADARAATEPVEELLWMGRLVDATDRDRPFRMDGEHDLEVQADDAILKALALGWWAWRTGAGTAEERAEVFRVRPAGRALVAWWAAIDVALPLAGGDLEALIAARGSQQLSRLAALAGEHSIEGALPATRALVPTLQRVVDLATRRSEALAMAAAPYVPGLLARADGAEEAVGARADRMPAYKLLAARLAAEHAATSG
jgi:hypothetical protein